MAFTRFLQTTGCKYTHFAAPSCYTTIESSISSDVSLLSSVMAMTIQTFLIPEEALSPLISSDKSPPPQGPVIRKLEKLPLSDLPSWVQQPPPTNGLKLLVHQWEPYRPGDGHDLYDAKSNLVFPARDKEHFVWLAAQMALPERYILTFSRRQATTVDVTRSKDGERMGQFELSEFWRLE